MENYVCGLVLLLTMGILLLFVSYCFYLDDKKTLHGFVITCILSIICFIMSGVFLNILSNTNEPKAIDVYRNNTTLQITYQDSIPVDSTVVYKENF